MFFFHSFKTILNEATSMFVNGIFPCCFFWALEVPGAVEVHVVLDLRFFELYISISLFFPGGQISRFLLERAPKNAPKLDPKIAENPVWLKPPHTHTHPHTHPQNSHPCGTWLKTRFRSCRKLSIKSQTRHPLQTQSSPL